MEHLTNIVAQISNIEDRATSLMKEVDEEKKLLDTKQKERLEAFDQEMLNSTQRELDSIQHELTTHMKDELTSQRAKTEKILNQMQAEFDEQHTNIAQKIVKSMIGA